MSHVNTTPHYGLPIYGENDIINPLTDFNDANSAIDTAIYEIADAQGSEAGAINDINTFLGDKELETVAQDVTDAINEVNTAVGNADTAIGNVAGDVVTLQSAVGNASTGLIHDVSDLQTTVGSQGNSISAIQLNVGALQGSMVTAKADISDIKLALQGLDGEDVAYDGTVSGLSATNVQSAIDEVAGKIPTDEILATLTTDGVKTYGTVMSELWGQITDKTKITPNTVLLEGKNVAHVYDLASTGVGFTAPYVSLYGDNKASMITYRMGAENKRLTASGGDNGADNSSSVVPTNTVFVVKNII